MARARSPLALLLVAVLVAGCGTSQTSPSPVPTATAAAASAATVDWHDASLAPAARAEALLAQMTIEEKIGQMTQLEKGSVDPEGVTNLLLGSVLSGGGGAPAQNDAAGWYRMVKDYQDAALDTRLGIPILYGVDAVHGHNNVIGATIFPQQVGLGASHDVDLVKRIGEATALEMAATGIRWDFGPVVAVPQDVRWGRTYEGYGEDPLEVAKLGEAFITGLQGDDLTRATSAAATAKHFVGDGGTAWGSSTTPGYSIDQGVNDVDEATFRAIHLAPYETALEAGARIVMASFSSTGAGKVHGDRHLLTEVLKGELGFSGFVVSDWAGVDQVDPDYDAAVATAISAGHRHGHGPERRPAVPGRGPGRSRERQDRPGADRRRRHPDPHGQVRDGPLRAPDARPRTTPRSAPTTTARSRARRSGSRPCCSRPRPDCCRWRPATATSCWPAPAPTTSAPSRVAGRSRGRARPGRRPPGTTIADDLRARLGDHLVDTGVRAIPAGTHAKTGIVVVAEPPYAEGRGRLGDARAPRGRPGHGRRGPPDGRPADRGRALRPPGDARHDPARPPTRWSPAWLPGTEGAGVGDVLFGDRPFTATTPYTWPKTPDDAPRTGKDAVRRRGLPARLRPGRRRVAARPGGLPGVLTGAREEAPPCASHAGLGYRPSVSDRHDPGPATLEPPAAPRPEDLVGRMIADRYRLDSVIGRGGMATIFRATDTRLGRPVALKLLRPEISADRDLADRFRREALAATVLRHGNIVPCLDTGSDPAGPFLVMELIDGEDLAARLRRTGALSVAEVARLGLDIARALGVGAHPRDRPSRREAGQHPAGPGRPGAHHGLRDRPAGGRRRGGARDDAGLRPVLQPGAGAGCRDHAGVGHLRSGPRDVRGADRPAAVARRHAGPARARPGRQAGALAA